MEGNGFRGVNQHVAVACLAETGQLTSLCSVHLYACMSSTSCCCMRMRFSSSVGILAFNQRKTENVKMRFKRLTKMAGHR